MLAVLSMAFEFRKLRIDQTSLLWLKIEIRFLGLVRVLSGCFTLMFIKATSAGVEGVADLQTLHCLTNDAISVGCEINSQGKFYVVKTEPRRLKSI